MPQAPSFADFSWNRIGSQPTLLKRLNEPSPNAGDEARQYSSSPSPDLEEALIPSGSSPNDDTEQLQPQPRRNPLLDSLAPKEDVDMDDMYVDDDVNRPVGADLRPTEKEAQAQSGASLRPQLRKASNGQFNTTNKFSALSQSRLNSGSTAAKISSASQEKLSAGTQAGSAIGNPAPAPGSTLAPVSARNHTVPPTPPPENDQLGQPSGQAQPTVSHYDLLRAVRQRLQTLLDDVSKPEPFASIRDLVQGAKVESHSVAIAAQKAVTLSQKALAFAQESLQASQGSAELARKAKKSWEATLNGCEQRIADQSAKQKQLQEAIKTELASLGEIIKLLEAEDRRGTQQAEQEALKRQRDQEIAANALHAAAATVGPSFLPTPPAIALPLNTASTTTAPTAPATEKQNDPALSASAYMVLAEQMNALRNEINELKNVGNSGTPQTTPETQVQVQVSQTANAFQSLPEQAMDPKLKEEVLRNKLMSHKKLSTSGSSAAPSRLPSNDLPASTQAHRTAPSGGEESKLEAVSTTNSEIKVKIEAQEAALLPFRKPLPSARQGSMQLEYPPSPTTFTETKADVEPTGALQSGSHQAGLALTGGNASRPLLKPLSIVLRASETSDGLPIHLGREGSGPGNLPLSLSEGSPHRNAPTSSIGQSPERRLTLASNAEFTRERPVSGEQAPHMMQEPTLPAIATIEEHSPTESNSSSSTPAPVPPVQASSPSKKKKGKGRGQIRPLQTATKPPASAQLPPKPAPDPAAVQAKPPSSASQTTAESIARPRTPSLKSSSMDLAQAISEANRTVPSPAPTLASRGGTGNVSIRRPSGPIRPLSSADRSYRPGRQQSRSRSPVRGRRDAPHREYDHYSPRRSPPRGRNDSVSVGRRRSPGPGRRSSPPPRIPGRVMKVQGRRSPGPPENASWPAPTSAGTKRPFEDLSAQGPASRRRIDESTGEGGASRPVPASSSESFNEGWSRRADYHSSPASRSPTRGAAAGASPLQSRDDERDRGRPGTSKPYLASRITAAESLKQDDDYDDDRMNNGWRSPVNTTSNRTVFVSPGHNESSSSSKLNLIDRFSTAPDPPSRNNHHPTRDTSTTRPARGRGGRGSGRGGGASGGPSHQSLNDRISSSSSSGNVHRPLLSRIDRVE